MTEDPTRRPQDPSPLLPGKPEYVSPFFSHEIINPEGIRQVLAETVRGTKKATIRLATITSPVLHDLLIDYDQGNISTFYNLPGPLLLNAQIVFPDNYVYETFNRYEAEQYLRSIGIHDPYVVKDPQRIARNATPHPIIDAINRDIETHVDRLIRATSIGWVNGRDGAVARLPEGQPGKLGSSFLYHLSAEALLRDEALYRKLFGRELESGTRILEIYLDALYQEFGVTQEPQRIVISPDTLELISSELLEEAAPTTSQAFDEEDGDETIDDLEETGRDEEPVYDSAMGRAITEARYFREVMQRESSSRGGTLSPEAKKFFDRLYADAMSGGEMSLEKQHAIRAYTLGRISVHEIYISSFADIINWFKGLSTSVPDGEELWEVCFMLGKDRKPFSVRGFSTMREFLQNLRKGDDSSLPVSPSAVHDEAPVSQKAVVALATPAPMRTTAEPHVEPQTQVAPLPARTVEPVATSKPADIPNAPEPQKPAVVTNRGGFLDRLDSQITADMQREAEAERLKTERETAQQQQRADKEAARTAREMASYNKAKSLFEGSLFPALLNGLSEIVERKGWNARVGWGEYQHDSDFSGPYYAGIHDDRNGDDEGSYIVNRHFPKGSYVIEVRWEVGGFSMKDLKTHGHPKLIGFYLEFRADGSIIGHADGKTVRTSTARINSPAFAESILGELYERPTLIREDDIKIHLWHQPQHRPKPTDRDYYQRSGGEGG